MGAGSFQISRLKLQIVEGMWNGFDFYFLDLDRIIRKFLPAARGLSAEGRIILTTLLILFNYFL